MVLPSNVQRAIDNGYQFRFGDYISRGFDLVKNNAGNYIVYTLIFFVVGWVVGAVFGVGGLALTTAGLAAKLAYQLIQQAVTSAVNGPFVAGYATGSHKIDSNQSAELNDFFKGFSKFMPLFITVLMSAVIMLVSCIPGLYFIMQSGIDFTNQQWFMNLEEIDLDTQSIFIGIALMLIPALYFTVSYVYAPFLVVFYDITGWDALEASRKLVANNFFGTLGFAIVVGLLSFLGIILLCIGILFTLPVGQAAWYAAFADIVRLHDKSENDLTDHFSIPGA